MSDPMITLFTDAIAGTEFPSEDDARDAVRAGLATLTEGPDVDRVEWNPEALAALPLENLLAIYDRMRPGVTARLKGLVH